MSTRSDNASSGAVEALWDAKDVAAYLKVSRSWVYQQAERGVLPCMHIVGVVRFEPSAVKAFARGERPGGRVLPLRSAPKSNDNDR
jgi:hypothetical protein